MLIETITIESVDLELLHNQRRDLQKVMKLDGVTELEQDNLEGLLILLDYICDKYEVLTQSCEHAFSTDGENGICMFCGADEIDEEEGE